MAETGRGRAGRETYPRRGEIYLTTLDPALGHEIKKTRPALVIQNDVTNRYAMTTVVAAITSRVSMPPYPNEVVVEPTGTGLEAVATIRLDQIRTVDRRRLIKRLGKIDRAAMKRVDDAIRISLGLMVL